MKLTPELKRGILFVLLIVATAGVVMLLLGQALSNKVFIQQPEIIKLPILMIAGVVALLLSLAVVSVVFAALNLSDKTQALALPEGSVRAVIALCLLVLFAIITIFLFGSLSQPAVDLREIHGLTDLQREEFLNKNQNLTSVVVIPYTIKENGKEETRYTVEYREKTDPDATARQRAKEDFAKQLLVLVGTLVTAVASFYFGTRAVAATQVEARVTGKLASVKPAKVVAGIGRDCLVGVPFPFREHRQHVRHGLPGFLRQVAQLHRLARGSPIQLGPLWSPRRGGNGIEEKLHGFRVSALVEELGGAVVGLGEGRLLRGG